MQRRGRFRAPTHIVPDISQFLSASCQFTLGVPATRSDQWRRLGQVVAALDASNGRWADRSSMDLAKGVATSGAAVATSTVSSVKFCDHVVEWLWYVYR